MKKLALFLICVFLTGGAFAQTPPPIQPPVNKQVTVVQSTAITNVPEIEQYTDIDVDSINLRNALELEQAAMEYVLAYEAYIEARKSKNPETKSKIVSLMKNYRQSYARFLNMLRQDNLYHPQKPKNPAGWYNKKSKKARGHERDWKKTDAKEIRKLVKEMVKNGASPEEIKEFIKESLPQQPLSSDPCSVSASSATSSPAPSRPPIFNSSQLPRRRIFPPPR
jgi:hypothetical protein